MDVIRALLSHPGIDPNWQNGDGDSALMLAARCKSLFPAFMEIARHPRTRMNGTTEWGDNALRVAVAAGSYKTRGNSSMDRC